MFGSTNLLCLLIVSIQCVANNKHERQTEIEGRVWLHESTPSAPPDPAHREREHSPYPSPPFYLLCPRGKKSKKTKRLPSQHVKSQAFFHQCNQPIPPNLMCPQRYPFPRVTRERKKRTGHVGTARLETSYTWRGVVKHVTSYFLLLKRKEACVSENTMMGSHTQSFFISLPQQRETGVR